VTKDGDTAIHYAAGSGVTDNGLRYSAGSADAYMTSDVSETVDLLLKAGADINVKNADGKTPLGSSNAGKKLEEFLRSRGAK